ncbi:MAG: transglycosylase SLT domain-containing protein, partial [Shewanella sp.]
MIKKSLVYLVSIGLYACIVQPVSAALTESQKNYVAARAALKSGDDYSYQRLKRRLADYPLVLYLNYHEKIDHLDGLSASQFAKWSAQFEDSPLYQGARHRFLMSAGKQEHWQDFLSISPSAPNSIELQCYYYQAQLAKGDKQAAFDGAKTLWLYGASQPKTCDELFSKWSNAGELSEALIWQRMLLAFDAKQLGLMSHLAKSMKSHKAQAQLLIDVYGDPKQLRHTQKFKKSDPLVADVVTIGLRKLAQNNLSKAFSLYQSYQQKGLFSKQQSQLVAHALVRRALINQDIEYLSRIDSLLPMINSDDVTEMRLRWAIRDNDLKSLTQFLPLLSPEAQQESRWQYWAARSRNDIELLKKLSAQRNFYGFYAAEQLQQDYQLAHIQLPALSQQQQRELQQTPGFLRMLEFKALDKKGSARIEWDYLIQNSDNGPAFGQLAIIKGWPELAIQATIAGKHWDHLALRFPIAFKDSMQAAARRHQVD